MLPVDHFKKEALTFWHEKQIQTLKEGGLNPQVRFWFGTKGISVAIPEDVLQQVESPLSALPRILRRLPVQAFAMVCETWAVQIEKAGAGDLNFARDLSRAHRLQYHPQRIEALCLMMAHPDYANIRQKEMIRTGKSESDKLIGLGIESILEQPDRIEGRFEECRKLLVR